MINVYAFFYVQKFACCPEIPALAMEVIADGISTLKAKLAANLSTRDVKGMPTCLIRKTNVRKHAVL